MFHTTVWERIEDAQRHDPAAVEVFVSRYRPPLLAYVRRWTVPGATPEDLVQEVLLELFARGALGRADRSRGSFRGYLLGLARNVVHQALRRAYAAKRGGGEGPATLADDVAAPEADERDFERIWCEHLLQHALDDLARRNPRQREALRQRFELGRTYDDIAADMGRTLQQVKNDIHRGREHLKAAVREAIAHYASSESEFLAELEAVRVFVGLWR